MKVHKLFGSSRLILICMLLIGGLTASAVTYADSLFVYFGAGSEGSITNVVSEAPVVPNSKPLLARRATLPGLTTPSMRALQSAVDVEGADDEPGQKDLNALTVDYGIPGATDIDVTWNWDDTSTSGANTRDAGSLFDTDGDGFANYSLYITVAADGSHVTQLFECTADSRADRCAGPTELFGFTSSATVSVVPNSDPFGVVGSPDFDASHVTGNTCRTNPACYTDDTVAVVDVDLFDIGDPESVTLLNVCSYPSGQPNSDPSDCVLAINPGSLTLVKVVDNLGNSGPDYLGVSDFPLSIDGNAATSGVPVSVTPGDHTIAEESQFGYDVGTWSCDDGTTGVLGQVDFLVNVGDGEAVVCTITNTVNEDILNPLLSIEKTSSTASYSAVGDIITYSITATNIGNTNLASVTITDTEAVLGTCNPANGSPLAPGESITCSATHTVTQADIDAGTYNNTACADDGDNPDGAAEVCDDADVPADQNPDLSITKTATEQSYDEVGDVINYTIVATNTGNVTLTNVTVTDPNVSNLVCDPATPVASLAPGGTITCTASHPIVQADLDAGNYANTACVDDGAGGADEACDSEDVPGDENPDLSITKTATEQSYDSVGDVINYTIVATNTGNVTLTNVTVTDPNVSNLVCDPATPVASLAPGETITCTASHTIDQADLDAGNYANTACVDDGEGGAEEACDSEDVPGDQNPAIDLEKSATPTFGTPPVAGNTILFGFTITNIGNVTLTGVDLDDALVGFTDATCDGVTTLAPGASTSCSATYILTQGDVNAGFVSNTADACGDPPVGSEVCDTDGTTTPVAQVFSISLDKTSDTTLITAAGQVVTYTYLVTNTGNTTLTNVTLVDDKVIAADITCTPTQPATLAPGGTMNCTGVYTVTQADIDSGGDLVNIATADSDETNPGTDDTVSIPVEPPPTNGNTYPTGKEPCEFANDPDGSTSEGPLSLSYKLDRRTSRIKNVSPANFFFYGYLTPSLSGTRTVTLEQSNDAGLPNMSAVEVKIYRSDSCNIQVGMPLTLNSTDSPLEFTFEGEAGVEYIVKVQYKPFPLVGVNFGTGGAIYQFSMSLDAGSSDSDSDGTPLVYSGN